MLLLRVKKKIINMIINTNLCQNFKTQIYYITFLCHQLINGVQSQERSLGCVSATCRRVCGICVALGVAGEDWAADCKWDPHLIIRPYWSVLSLSPLSRELVAKFFTLLMQIRQSNYFFDCWDILQETRQVPGLHQLNYLVPNSIRYRLVKINPIY